MTPIWRPNPRVTSYQFDVLATDEDFAQGHCIAWVEDFGYACYPTALNAATGNLERGGPHSDRAAAYAWAERVAGLHPVKTGDDREPFYYAAPRPAGDTGGGADGAASIGGCDG